MSRRQVGCIFFCTVRIVISAERFTQQNRKEIFNGCRLKATHFIRELYPWEDEIDETQNLLTFDRARVRRQ